MRPRLSLEGVGKRYSRSHWVLRDVDLTVDHGEVVAIAGANGVGKSTLLRLAVGATRPSAGRVAVAAGGVRWVPDRVAVEPRLSAIGYLRHMGRIQGLSGRGAETRGHELLERLQLVGGPREPMGTLSKGNAQKVVLAQAVLTPPTLLVLDEPWAGLDTAARVVLAQLLDEVAAADGGVVFTDHGQAAVSTVPTRYRLAAGGLAREAGTRRPDVVVELSGAGRTPAQWPGYEGVTAARTVAGRVRLDVRPDAVDAVLRSALDASWSVDRVDPGPP